MALLKGRDVHQQQQMYQPQPQMQQQPQGPTRRQQAFKALKYWTIFCLVMILANAADSWAKGYVVMHSFTGGFVAWFLGILAIFIGIPYLTAVFKSAENASRNFWDQR